MRRLVAANTIIVVLSIVLTIILDCGLLSHTSPDQTVHHSLIYASQVPKIVAISVLNVVVDATLFVYVSLLLHNLHIKTRQKAILMLTFLPWITYVTS